MFSGAVFVVFQSCSVLWDPRTPIFFTVFVPVTLAYVLVSHPIVASLFLILSNLATYLLLYDPVQRGMFLSFSVAGYVVLGLFISNNRQRLLSFILTQKEHAHIEKIRLMENFSTGLVRILCHDLSNSISAVIGHAEILYEEMRQDQINTEKTRRSLDMIRKAGEMQKSVIENVRYRVALRTGKRPLTPSAVDLVGCLRNAICTFQDTLDKKQIHLRWTPPPNGPSMIKAEAVSLTVNVLENLISNALKFSFVGGLIEIRVSDVSGNKVLFEIRDHGIGMSPELLDNLFKPDYSSSRCGTNGEKGTGFGMLIVEEVLNLFNAEIKIMSSTEETSPGENGTKIEIFFEKMA